MEDRIIIMKKFKSDGCSMFPDGHWVDCCYWHDKKYYEGGTSKDRSKADWDMLGCVWDKGHPIVAIVMHLGVRLFGAGILPTPFRWGFGHKWPRSKPKKVKKGGPDED